jgi:hypothetical protein
MPLNLQRLSTVFKESTNMKLFKIADLLKKSFFYQLLNILLGAKTQKWERRVFFLNHSRGIQNLFREIKYFLAD